MAPTCLALLVLSHGAYAQWLRRLQRTVDQCSGPIRAADCAPEEEIPKCDYTGKWCWLYDAIDEFCPKPEDYFNNPDFSGPRAEGPKTCTTTTTTTVTVTSTTTSSTTYYTTTQPPPEECRAFCYENSHPWLVKCGWSVCGACTECASVYLPTTLAPNTFPPLPDLEVRRPKNTSADVNASSSEIPASQATAGSTIASGNANVIDPAEIPLEASEGGSLVDFAASINKPPPPPPTTTLEPLESRACLKLCYRASDDNGISWDRLCEWATCVNCPECSGTTTTQTTTSVMTTSSFTASSTDTTLFPPTRTQTMTRTKTTSTITVTSSSTITLTTTDRPCAPISPNLAGLIENQECAGGGEFTNNISSGKQCFVEKRDHPCLYEGSFLFDCPKSNIDHREPELKSGTWNTKCKICGFYSTEINDTDWKPDQMKVNLKFGANALLGDLDEEIVSGYGITLADNCSRPLIKDVIGYIPKLDPYPHDDRCCTPDAYEIDLEFKLPPGYKSAILMVLVNTSDGFFVPVGDVTAEIWDWDDPTQGDSGAWRQAPLGLRCLLFRLLLLSFCLPLFQ